MAGLEPDLIRRPPVDHYGMIEILGPTGLTRPSIPAKNVISVQWSEIKNSWFWSKGWKNKSGSLKCFNPDNLSGLTFYQKLKYMFDFVFKHVIPTCYVLILTDIPIIQVWSSSKPINFNVNSRIEGWSPHQGPVERNWSSSNGPNRMMLWENKMLFYKSASKVLSVLIG